MFVLFALLIFLALIVFLLVYHYRRNKDGKEAVVVVDEECCGAHEVCERESLLSSGGKIVYYDDEELDTLSGLSSQCYTPEQIGLLSEVFYTLKESDVSGWLRSLQLRQIELPQDLKDAAFMIVSERRTRH